MRGRMVQCVAVGVGLACLGGIVGCGGSSEPEVGHKGFPPRYEAPENAVTGGELRVLASGDVDSLDPGAAQNQFAFMISFATQRRLLRASDDGDGTPVADLAVAPPVTDHHRSTVTFELKRGIRFSPPVGRPVVSKDFKYAIERSLLPGIANGYVSSFLGKLKGFGRAKLQVKRDPRRAPEISGIETMGRYGLRLSFAGDVPPLAVDSLTLPLGAPVPAEYARPFDASIPSTYGQHVVGTGPYMVEIDDDGHQTGHRPGVSIDLVRNPNWVRHTDTQSAFLDRIKVESGYSNTGAASTRILTGTSRVNGDFAPDPSVLEAAATERPEQLMMVPAGIVLYAALNTKVPPLDDLDVRRAILAAADRYAMRLAHGGSFVGPLATHFLPPKIPGFEEAGGLDGPGFDFMADPNGDPDLAAEYMKRAGYVDGKYTGDEKLTLVTDTSGIGRQVGEIVKQAVESVGIPVLSSAVTRDTMYSRFCNVPKAEVAICPNVGWVSQLGDPQTVLDETFSGESIQSMNNSNWSQLDDPTLNRMIDRARHVSDPEARSRAWGEIDRRVTGLAPAIPIMWNEIPYISSENVVNVIDWANAGPSLTEMSLVGGD